MVFLGQFKIAKFETCQLIGLKQLSGNLGKFITLENYDEFSLPSIGTARMGNFTVTVVP